MTTRTPNPLLLAALALCLLVGPALADGERVDETRQVDGDAEITLEVLAGTLEIIGWDRDECRVEGVLDPKAKKLEIDGGGDELKITVKYPRNVRKVREGSRLTVHVPRGCRLLSETVSADVSVEKVDGRVVVETVSGEVEIRDDPSSLLVSAVSSTIDVVTGCAEIEIESVSGTILVEGARGELEISTVSGEARVSADTLDRFTFNAVSGSLDLRADPAEDARWEIDCHSGEIELHLPADVNARFDIDAFSGDIDDDFGHKAERTSKYAPGKELRFTQGNGSARIDISIFSGDVNLIKR